MRQVLRTVIMQGLLVMGCFVAGTAIPVNADDRDTTTKVNGVIDKMQSGLMSVTTSWGHMSIQSDALADAKVGDEVTVWVNENNVVIDAYPKGATRPEHRWIRGKLTYPFGDMTEIKLMTSEGAQSFSVQHGESKLSGMKEGTAMTVELNETGHVIEICKAG